MTDPKKREEKVFTTVEQLEAELFPNKSFVLDENVSEEKTSVEADILAKKLIDDLIQPMNKKEK